MNAVEDGSRVALGYIRCHLLMTEDELADTKHDLGSCAERHGYALGKVYVERIDRTPAAFDALMAHLQRQDVGAVIVPGNHHLAVLGDPNALKDHLEHTTGVRVIARDSP